MSYVTGSHAFKVGTNYNWGTNSATYSPNGQIYSLYFLAGAPTLSSCATRRSPRPTTWTPIWASTVRTRGPWAGSP